MNAVTLSRRQAVAALTSTAALPLLGGCTRPLSGAAPAPLSPSAAEQFATIHLDATAKQLLVLQPETATSLGIDNGEFAFLRSALTDRSPDGQKTIADSLRGNLARFDGLDTSRLSHSTRTSVEVVKSAYRTALEGFAFPYGDVAVGSWRNSPYVVIQNVGAYLDIPRFLDSEHQVKTAADAEAWTARLGSYPRQLDGELERMRQARSVGMIPPAFLIDTAIKQMEASIRNAREGGPFVEQIRAKTKNISGNWTEMAQLLTTRQVAPALERQLAELRLQRAQATDIPGMWSRPQGEAYYRWAAKAATTTTMSPDEIHQLGIDTLAKLHAQMDTILRGLGYTQGTVGQRMLALSKDQRFRFPDNDAGRAEVLAFIQQRIALIRAKMPQAFNTLVRGNVEVRRLPPEEEPGAPGAYGGAGSIDGTIPGKFWINLKPGFDHTKYSLPSLTHHEAIPGHVWQGEYANKLPLIRTLLSFSAYSEGWALYAEQLADELGVYDGDPAGRLGYLDSIAFRACRLVVDTGLHHKRWTRQQARAYFAEQLGDPNESEVDRYCSWPGQALSYEVGHQEINRQRERARAALGTRFDLRAFNDTVVLGGNVPLDVLALNVDEYVGRPS